MSWGYGKLFVPRDWRDHQGALGEEGFRIRKNAGNGPKPWHQL